MKKLVPFIFPAIALVIVLALLVRWYSLRTNSNGEITSQAQSIEVAEVSVEDQNRLNSAVSNLQAVELEPAATVAAKTATGSVRYEIVDEKLNFSVMATLPQLQTGVYQVWLRTDDRLSKAMTLIAAKGGWMASGSINVEHLPLEIVVSRELDDDNQVGEILLNGRVEAAQ